MTTATDISRAIASSADSAMLSDEEPAPSLPQKRQQTSLNGAGKAKKHRRMKKQATGRVPPTTEERRATSAKLDGILSQAISQLDEMARNAGKHAEAFGRERGEAEEAIIALRSSGSAAAAAAAASDDGNEEQLLRQHPGIVVQLMTATTNERMADSLCRETEIWARAFEAQRRDDDRG